MPQAKFSDGRYGETTAAILDFPNRWQYAAASGGISNTATPVVIKAAVTGQSNVITSIQITTDALTNATELVVTDGASNTLWRQKIGTAGIPGGQSFTILPPLVGASGQNLQVTTLTASGAGAVYFNCQGYQV